MKIPEEAIISPEESATFSISSSYQGFANRQKNLFEQLNLAELNSKNLLASNTNDSLLDVEDPHDNALASNVDDSVLLERSRNRKKLHHHSKESIFKKPQFRPPRNFLNRRAPDYQVNPHRWTRYTLSDVKSDDMSEHANTAAAMSFLKEMEQRKTNDEMSEEGETSKKITFKKASRKVDNKQESSSASCFRNSKVVMPEYVVGQKKMQKRKEKSAKDDTVAKEIKLDHLLEEDEEES